MARRASRHLCLNAPPTPRVAVPKPAGHHLMDLQAICNVLYKVNEARGLASLPMSGDLRIILDFQHFFFPFYFFAFRSKYA